MPIITLAINCEVSSELRLVVVERLTDITCSVLGKKRALTVVRIDALPVCDFYIAGKSTDCIVAHLAIAITAGSNSQVEKTAWIKAAWQTLREVSGVSMQPSYILIHEVPGNSWGYNGLSQFFRSGL